jgi:acyl transferase domain-containing protein/SAM-dependent methyltransferase/acyl carrier protein
MSSSGVDPIAIVGIGCRFPGASGPEAFWQLLIEHRDAIVDVPADRWNRDVLHHGDPASAPGTVRSRRGGFLDQIDLFDAGFFGISPREAAAMDPQQRLLLEVSWEALEDAGLVADSLRGGRVGVFVGIAAYDYAEIQHAYDNRHLIGPHTNTGLALSIAANRISYVHDFRGPSVAVDTACSSSLVAVHLACNSLRAGESHMALVAGVNAILKPEPTIGFSRATMLSPDGLCKTFDARADGYTRGEGAGVVVLKRFADALCAGDRVYALIRGSAVNQDGRTDGMSVPSQHSQEVALRDALRMAEVDPADVQYVEAHGTGTPVGDPIEARALGSVLASGRRRQNCIIGSVKTNIGHLEAAAGIAGLIKAALAIERRTIPAILHFERLNPDIPLDDLRLRLALRTEPWPEDGRPARAGVNSFGFGGTNAHVVLEEAPTAVPGGESAGPTGDVLILPLSARAPESLSALCLSYADFIVGATPTRLRQICYSAAVRRSHHAHRAAAIGRSAEELTMQLRNVATVGAPPEVGRARDSQSGPAFVFSGMGAQWWAMGRGLLDAEPVFRETIERCDAVFIAHAGWSLLRELRADESASRMARTDVSQPCSLALQLALTELWRSWGIVPSAVVGHSAGEMAACQVAGVLTLEETIAVAYARSRLQQTTSGRGKMAAAGLSRVEATDLIAPYGGRVSIGAVNGPDVVTLSGDNDAIDAIVAELNHAKVFVRLLRVDVPYHSHHMDALEGELRAALSCLRPRPPSVPLFSTVTGAAVEGWLYDADYWWRNVREPVFFAAAITAMANAGHEMFLEVGAHPVLGNAISECLAAGGHKGAVIASLRRDSDERATVLRALGQLYAAGAEVNWRGVYQERMAFVRPPLYAWHRQPYWRESARSKAARLSSDEHPLLGRRRAGPRAEWENLLDARVLNYLRDHRVDGAAIFPGAGYVEIALAVGRAELGVTDIVVEDAVFERALLLHEAEPVQVVVSYDPDASAVAVQASGDGTNWALHARCEIRPSKLAPARSDLEALQQQCRDQVSDPYAIFTAAGLDYGPAFQRIESLWRGPNGALARLKPELGDSRYLLHPVLLDACFQTLAGMLASDRKTVGYLPVSVERLTVRRSAPLFPTTLWAHAHAVKPIGTRLVGDIRLFDQDGNVLAEVRGLACQALNRRPGSSQTLNSSLYAFRWQVDGVTGVVAEGLLRPQAVENRIGARIADVVDATERENYYDLVEPALDLACAQIAAGTFARLGLSPGEDDMIDVAELCAKIGAAPQHQRLVARMLTMLEIHGLARRVSNRWQICSSIDTDAGVAAILEKLARRFPLYAPEIDLLRRCAEALPEVLRGEADPLQILFPSGSHAVVERIYRDSRTFGIYNGLGREVIGAIVDALPDGSALRVLEIGGGVGSLTAAVLDRLPADRTQYTFTDISGNFIQRAAQKFSQFRFVDYRTLDLERAPAAQGFTAHGFDIVLASDVIHATRDLMSSLVHIHDLLAPGGLLVACELTKPPFWFDLVFGLLHGWWAFDDAARTDHACLPGTVWRNLLYETGFAETVLLSEGNSGNETVHSVMIARAAGRDQTQGPGGAVPGGTWLLISDAQGIGSCLRDELTEAGQTVVVMDRSGGVADVNGGGDPSSLPLRTGIARTINDIPDLRGAVFLWALDQTLPESAADVLDVASESCAEALDLMQAMAEAPNADGKRVILATSGAMHVLAADLPDPVQASLWGLARVFFNEYPGTPSAIVDLSSSPSRVEIAALAAECLLESGEREIAFRAHSRFVHRLEAAASPDSDRFSYERPRRPDEPFTLDYLKPGAFENLLLRASTAVAPGPGQVRIEVAAAGLNFRDVMKVLDIYPSDGDARQTLGDECAGTVVAVGAGICNFAVGDRVVAIASGFNSSVTVAQEFVARLPASVPLAEGATIPITFLTAHYGLNRLAHLRAGERVLIHAAAGGVGQAALQLATLAGGEVFATAGTAEKRDALRAMGVANVFDSRSLDFADEIMEVTSGRGVDVVLNSLSGRAIDKSLSVLAPYGRFLEIGKTEIYRDTKLGLRPFRKNLSYFAIDLDAVFKERPALAQELLREIMEWFEEGRLVPLVKRVFPVSDAESAFRHMAQARHVGKVVLRMQDERARVSSRRFEAVPLQANAQYLITGGLGGLGRALARWMCEQGARHVVLVGRNRPSEAVWEEIEVLRASGATVEALACDVTDEIALNALLAALRRNGPPLRGLIHAAMVLDDGLIAQLDHARLRRVLAPKIAGAWALHRATRDDPLDFFVSFSSFAAVVGNIGQGNYAAANAFLDALAQRRRVKGNPSLTVDWGAISGDGYVARHGDIEQHFRRQGLRPFSSDQAFAMLGSLLRSEAVTVGVVDMDWAAWSRHAPEMAQSPRFRHLIKEDDARDAASDAPVLSRLRAASANERKDIVVKLVQEQLSAVLGLDTERIDAGAGLSSLGLDSLMAVELSCLIEDRLGFKPGTIQLMQSPSLTALADQLIDKVVL